ncbi:MAG: GNAT family N-acetyltransferase [Chthoniobacteraceae bacterium]|jgi:predicted N-acetyltransferase YhbS
MRVLLRPPAEADVTECGRICYEAFSAIAITHGFPVDWRTEEMAVQVIQARLAHRQTYGVVAEVDGRIAGSAFLKEYRPVGAIGPVTVTPRLQGGEVGRLMMEHLLERARVKGLEGTRLVQAAYNTHSLALYTKLGFEMRELLACLHGDPIAMGLPGCRVTIGKETDVAECNELCRRLHGYARTEDLDEAMRLRTLTVVERQGRVRGYSTGIHFRGHTVAETNEDAKALIAAAEDLPDPGLLMPARNGELLRWALEKGLRITQPLTLMTQGFYREPAGAFLPSIHA